MSSCCSTQSAPASLELELSSSAPDCVGVIVAGGSGQRFGATQEKQFVELCGLPMFCWSLFAFDRAPSIKSCVLVCPPAKQELIQDIVHTNMKLLKPLQFADAGQTRQESVFSGIFAAEDARYLAVHDAARPLIESEFIEEMLNYLRAHTELAGVIAAAHVSDTLKLVDEARINSTPDRSLFWAAQTPQIFKTELLRSAHEQARLDGIVATDDASLLELGNQPVEVFENTASNIKVTLPEDIFIAELVLQARIYESPCNKGQTPKE